MSRRAESHLAATLGLVAAGFVALAPMGAGARDVLAGAAAPDTMGAVPAVGLVRGSAPTTLQESILLHRLTPAFLPPDGLLRFSLGVKLYGTPYEISGFPRTIDLRDFVLGLEYGLLPGLHLRASQPYRQWSEGVGEIPASGSGLGDGDCQLVAGLPRPASFLAWALRVGSSLPTGDRDLGLSEGKASPHAVLAVSIRAWQRSQLPEMRLHLNAGYRRNSNRDGFGAAGGSGFQPWPPRYPAVAEGGEARDNDFLLLGAALEFRQGDTSLYVEYSEARLPWAEGVADREYQRFLSAGLCWGRTESLALSLTYDVSLALEDRQTAFTAAYPDLVTRLALSYQFPLGGRDIDDDGIPDRKDRCPEHPEDRDGFLDQDGCPDLDNDGDGIPDSRDGAPLQAEDRDGFADGDGVPDPDNDGDGIPDAQDDCPDEAEDLDGHRDDDGCPDVFLDRDGDGIEDAEDRCPDRAEDLDGFEDQDGCPEQDNDLDGIEDELDDCPDQAEDYDGIEDDDGCPDEADRAAG